MKRIFTKSRIVGGCVAIALATGFSTGASAEPGTSYRHPAQFENIFLGEIATTNYSEVSDDHGIVGEVELVRERYADGKVRIERQVTLNGENNYVNHGAWKQYSTTGDVVAEGQYNFGQRTGLWTHWIGRNDASLVGELPFKQFKAPFMSQANFVDGKVDGEWIITDANERKVMAILLKAGQRNGLATLWLPNGKIYSQTTYEQSIPVGDQYAINPKTGEVTKSATFDQGRKVITKTEYYPRGKQMKSQISYLSAKSLEKTQDDFWATKLAQYGTDGEDMRNGPMKTWFANGQQEEDGFYTNDQKTGTFKYWHENGQLAASGDYRDNVADGTWVWWHENGQKSAVGKYEQGKLVGDWRWWNEDGKLTKQQTYHGTESASTASDERLDVGQLPSPAMLR